MSETIIPVPYTVVDPVETPGRLDLDRAHRDDAAVDLRATEDVYLAPGERALVKTGVRVALPEGFAGLVLPRSGLALKYGVTVLNAPGLIDPGYRGEVGVILHNTDSSIPFEFGPSERIAQLLIIRTADTRFDYLSAQDFRLWDAIHKTDRGEGGFGSTGR